MEAIPYTPDLKATWDRLVDGARNGHFQIRRDYMDYHADRFPDRSFIFRENDKWLGVVPGHDWGEHGWATHRGLTFGGLVLSPEAHAHHIRGMLNCLHADLASRGVRTIRWRPMPWFHAREPAQEDLYFLFRLGARLVSRTLGNIVEPDRIRLDEKRLRSCIKSTRLGLRIERRDDWENFWSILEENLWARHEVKPVHSLDEIRLLASRFPDNVHLFGAIQGDEWMGGMVIYRSPEVFHIQYSASTEEGRARGAATVLGYVLGREHALGSSRWMSYGNSCEQGGLVLNDGLVAFKERLGGHGVVYDEYEYEPATIPVDGT